MTEAIPDHKKNLKECIVEYSQFLLILPLLFFSASYLFNLSYFIMFGIKFWKIPLSSSDYIVSVNTLGIVIIFLLIYFILISILGSLANLKGKKYIFLLENDSLECKLEYKRKKKLLTFLFIIVIVDIILLLLHLFLISEFLWINILLILFLCMLTFTAKHNIFNTHIRILIATCILSIAMIICYAFISAVFDYTDNSSTIDIQNRMYYNMRSFDSGFFVRRIDSDDLLFITHKDEKILFSPPDKLKNLIKRYKKTD